jgi:hypothetical protein
VPLLLRSKQLGMLLLHLQERLQLCRCELLSVCLLLLVGALALLLLLCFQPLLQLLLCGSWQVRQLEGCSACWA